MMCNRRLIAEFWVDVGFGNRDRLLVFDGGDGTIDYDLSDLRSMIPHSISNITFNRTMILPRMMFSSDKDTIDSVSRALELGKVRVDKIIPRNP